MSLKLIALKFDPLRNWALKSIPRGVYPIYKIWIERYPDLTERELAISLFNRRFSTKPLLSSPQQEQGRIKCYFDNNPEPENLADMCIASAMIEFRVPAENRKTYNFIRDTISAELFRLGYRKGKVKNGNR